MILTPGERQKVIAAAVLYVEKRDNVQLDDCAWTHEHYDTGIFTVVVADSCQPQSTVLLREEFSSADEALAFFAGQERLL